MSERVKIKLDREVQHMPAIALRGLVVFPNNVVHFEVGRERSIAAVEWAMENTNAIFLVAQREMDVEEPGLSDLYTYGVVAEVKQVLRVSNELVKVLVEGKYRAKLLGLDNNEKYLQASIRPAPVRGLKAGISVDTDALVRSIKETFENYLALNPRLSKDVVYNILSSDDPAYLSEYIPANLLFKYQDRQMILDENTLTSRLEHLLVLLRRECQILKIEKELEEKVEDQMDKNQREYYLSRADARPIAEELGESEDSHDEASRYLKKIQQTPMGQEATEKLTKEAERLARMQSSSPEAAVVRTYLDTCLDLPWIGSHGGQSEYRPCPADPGQGALWPCQGEGPHPGAAGRAQAQPGRKGADHLPGGPSGCGQDLHCPLGGPVPGPQVRPDELWAACGTRRRSGGTGAPISAPCPARSSAPSRRPKAATL